MKRVVVSNDAKEFEYVDDVDYDNKFVFILLGDDIGRLDFRGDSRKYYMYCITRVRSYPWNIQFYDTARECVNIAINRGATVFSFDTSQEAIAWMYETSKLLNIKKGKYMI
jgi:hypothetical protein